MENTNEMNKKDLFKKIGSIVLNVLFYLFLALLLLVSIANIRSAKTSDGSDRIPNIFGVGYATVLSDSMAPEFHKGDIIKVKIANDKVIENLKVGDVITFHDININKTLNDMNVLNEGFTLNTHRIVDIIVEDGVTKYIAQGDYLNGTDNEYKGDREAVNGFIQTVTAEDIKAVYVSKLGKGASGFLAFIKSQLGFALCIVLPTAILLVFEATLLIMNIVKLNKEKMAAQLANAKEEMTEEEKQKMREELKAQLLAEMEAEKDPVKEEPQEEAKESEE